jgi:Collagen triple helix repeat (20 copies)
MDLQTAFDRGFESVKRYVDSELEIMAARLIALETRPAEKGEPGPQGRPGECGAAGPPGEVGPAGPSGLQGVPGERGADGAQGPPGLAGARGEKGDTGRDGRDAGDLALIGSYIVEQIDATLLERFKTFAMVTADGGRILTATFGAVVCEIKTELIIDRGVWAAERTYMPGDAISQGGSLFIAQQETSEKPGKSDQWRLAVKRGADGRDWRPEEKPQLEPVRFK